MDLTARLRAVIRAAVGLPVDPSKPPFIDRLALYRAEVRSASADGKTVDVAPTDSRIKGHQGVPLRVSPPGAVAVVQPGAVVLIGWDGGDPEKIYAMPSWEDGATVTKLVLNAQQTHLGGEGGDDVLTKADMTALITAITTMANTGNTGGALSFTAPASYGSAVVKAKRS